MPDAVLPFAKLRSSVVESSKYEEAPPAVEGIYGPNGFYFQVHKSLQYKTYSINMNSNAEEG